MVLPNQLFYYHTYADNPILMISCLTKQKQQATNTEVFSLLKNHKIKTFTSLYIIQLLSKQSLLEVEHFMRKQTTLNITQFMRFFRGLLPFDHSPTKQQQFFLNYGLFKMFQEICYHRKKLQVTFSQISSFITEKIPTFQQEYKIQEKLLPVDLDFDQKHHKSIVPPQVYGQQLQDRVQFRQLPVKSDRIQHLNREVGQAQYSKKFKMFFYMDCPSSNLRVLDNDFNEIISLKTEQDISKRDMIVTAIAWSDHEQKIACLLGNYSISMWSKQDQFKYEVNVPLPSEYLSHPYVIIRYMQSMKKWVTVDNRPAVYLLNSYNYEPESVMSNPKICKIKQTEKVLIEQLKYVKLLCLAFERNLFLVSLSNKQIVSELYNFSTSITSIAFSESYQALFVSTYESSFKSYELSEFQDLLERGRFSGHKQQISLLGVVESYPVVFSIQENSILKMFDISDNNCYHSFSVLKNILYKQILYLHDGICLVGSKMHVYQLQKELGEVVYLGNEKSSSLLPQNQVKSETIIYISTFQKNLLVVTHKCLRVYDIRNGALVTVVKAIFDGYVSTNVFSAYVMDSRDKIMVHNEDGICKIIGTDEMSEVAVWELNPYPLTVHYDSKYELITQVSLGNIQIHQYSDMHCRRSLCRKITSQSNVRLVKVCEANDIMCVCYENDPQLWFYAYEKGKLIGSVNLGQDFEVRFQNKYIMPKDIFRVVDLHFIEHYRALFILLNDQLLLLKYDRTALNMSFTLIEEIELWAKPIQIQLRNSQSDLNKSSNKQEQKFTISMEDEQLPLHSTYLIAFEDCVIAVSNKSCLFGSCSFSLSELNLQLSEINKQNFNPYRVGSETHKEGIGLSPLSIDRDIRKNLCVAYHYNQHIAGSCVHCNKLGNLLVIADDDMNIVLYEYPEWDHIAGLINCKETLPKSWEVSNFSQQQVQEVEFVLKYLQNEQRAGGTVIRRMAHNELDRIKAIEPRLSKITITDLIKQHALNNIGAKSYKACSLREKKLVLEKERGDRERMQNFLQQKKIIDKKNQLNPLRKDITQKEISQTVGYLSLQHNEFILNRGIIDQHFPQVKTLESKLNRIVDKDEKKSLFSRISPAEPSLAAQLIHKSNKSVPELLRNPLNLPRRKQMAQKLRIKSYSSRQLLQTLKNNRNTSKRKLTKFSSVDLLPDIHRH